MAKPCKNCDEVASMSNAFDPHYDDVPDGYCSLECFADNLGEATNSNDPGNCDDWGIPDANGIVKLNLK